MKIIIVAIGSQGDVNPFVKIGTALHQRGHDVMVLSNNYFKTSVQDAGLDFTAVGSTGDFEKMVNTVDLKNPAKTMMPILDCLYFPSMEPVYDAINKLFTPGETVVMAITLAFGARMAREKLGVPLVTCHLSPVSFRSSLCPARHDGLWMPHWMPRFYKDGMWRLIDVIADKMLAPPINGMREKIDLPPVRRVMKDWIHSPDKVIGFFPEWFAEPQADWPGHTELSGFVFFDEADTRPMPPELETFLSNGDPPVVFTPGTAVKNAGMFFKNSIKACEKLKCRAVFLSQYKDQIPENLPADIYFCRYAPFSKLLPSASAIVHHGGIGTCAQALKAGIPQLLVPSGLDQHDNASRLSALGLGAEICMKKYQATAVTDRLGELTKNSRVRMQCRKIAADLKSNDPVSRVCDIVESMTHP